MIDYVKLNIVGCDRPRLVDLSFLDFKRTVSERTGELSNMRIAKYHFCEIKVYDNGPILFIGSLHKLYNSLAGITAPYWPPNKSYNGYNGNQFLFENISFIVEHLKWLFGVEPHNMVIQNIEIGQNLTLPFDPQKFIEGLLMYMGKPFRYNFDGFFAQSVHSQYVIKIYNKGNQYGLPLHTLRFEIKTLKMQYLNKELDLNTVADFSHEKLDRAFDLLKKRLAQTLYYDTTINTKGMGKRLRTVCKDLSNPRYWIKLPSNKRDSKRKRLQSIIVQYSQNLTLEILFQLEQNRVIFYRISEKQKRVIFYTSNIGANNTLLPSIKCLVTGVDISMQKRCQNSYRIQVLNIWRKPIINDLRNCKRFYLLDSTIILKERSMIR